MNKFLLVLGFSLVVSCGFCQHDKVFLKNGSKIRGTVIKDGTTDSITVRMAEGAINIPLSVVEVIHFRKRDFGRPDKYRDLMYEKGYYTTLKAGAAFGNHSYEDALKIFLTLQAMYEYHYHPLLNGGAGTGLNFYDRYMAIPVFLQYQAVLGRKNRTLFAYGQAGHGFIIQRNANNEFKDVDSGRYLACGIGVQKKAGQGFLRYQLGINSQRVWEIQEPLTIWSWPRTSEKLTTRKRDMNRLIFSVSYSF